MEKKWPLKPAFISNIRKLSETWSRCWKETLGEYIVRGMGDKRGESRER